MIRVRGARTRNLKAVDLDLPLHGIIAITGVSGSGKTSFALDTLHATARRRYLAAMGGEVLDDAPPVDLVAGLPPTLAVPARPSLPSARTVGELSGVSELLAVLFARWGAVSAPGGGPPLACHSAESIADALAGLPDRTKITILAPLWRQQRDGLEGLVEELRRQGFARVRMSGRLVHLDELTRLPAGPVDLDLVVDRVRVRPGRGDRLEEAARTALAAGSGRMIALVEAPGAAQQEQAWADHPWDPHTDTSWPRPRPAHLDVRRKDGRCPSCLGAGCDACERTGAHPLSLVLELGGQTWRQLGEGSVSRVLSWCAELPADPARALLLDPLTARLRALCALGLGHLPLSRSAASLAAGEAGRLVLAARTQLDLTDVVVLLDEPGSGLAAGDLPLLLQFLRGLRERGLPVIVIDHHPDVLRLADTLVEFGPGAGQRGGEVLYVGPLPGLLPLDTPTARALRALPLPAPPGPRTDGPTLVLRGATGRNLQGVDLEAPVGGLTVVTGPSGAGKRTLVDDTLGPALAAQLNDSGAAPLPFSSLDLPPGLRRVVRLQRNAASRSPRSCVATACGAWTPLRGLLAQTREAKVRGFGPEHFSFNTPAGRCPTCGGIGVVEEQVAGLEPVTHVCPACEGGRLARASRAIRWQGYSAADLLLLDVDAALALFAQQRRIRGPLEALSAVGLGHLPLGRSLGSLSGGEQQRLQLARELARAGDPTRLSARAMSDTAMVLESPLMGLHPQDAVGVASALRRMADAGATLVCSEVNPALLAVANRVVELGPGAGPEGGRIVRTLDAPAR